MPLSNYTVTTLTLFTLCIHSPSTQEHITPILHSLYAVTPHHLTPSISAVLYLHTKPLRTPPYPCPTPVCTMYIVRNFIKFINYFSIFIYNRNIVDPDMGLVYALFLNKHRIQIRFIHCFPPLIFTHCTVYSRYSIQYGVGVENNSPLAEYLTLSCSRHLLFCLGHWVNCLERPISTFYDHLKLF